MLTKLENRLRIMEDSSAGKSDQIKYNNCNKPYSKMNENDFSKEKKLEENNITSNHENNEENVKNEKYEVNNNVETLEMKRKAESSGSFNEFKKVIITTTNKEKEKEKDEEITINKEKKKYIQVLPEKVKNSSLFGEKGIEDNVTLNENGKESKSKSKCKDTLREKIVKCQSKASSTKKTIEKENFNYRVNSILNKKIKIRNVKNKKCIKKRVHAKFNSYKIKSLFKKKKMTIDKIVKASTKNKCDVFLNKIHQKPFILNKDLTHFEIKETIIDKEHIEMNINVSNSLKEKKWSVEKIDIKHIDIEPSCYPRVEEDISKDTFQMDVCETESNFDDNRNKYQKNKNNKVKRSATDVMFDQNKNHLKEICNIFKNRQEHKNDNRPRDSKSKEKELDNNEEHHSKSLIQKLKHWWLRKKPIKKQISVEKLIKEVKKDNIINTFNDEIKDPEDIEIGYSNIDQKTSKVEMTAENDSEVKNIVIERESFEINSLEKSKNPNKINKNCSLNTTEKVLTQKIEEVQTNKVKHLKRFKINMVNEKVEKFYLLKGDNKSIECKETNTKVMRDAHIISVRKTYAKIVLKDDKNILLEERKNLEIYEKPKLTGKNVDLKKSKKMSFISEIKNKINLEKPFENKISKEIFGRSKSFKMPKNLCNSYDYKDIFKNSKDKYQNLHKNQNTSNISESFKTFKNENLIRKSLLSVPLQKLTENIIYEQKNDNNDGNDLSTRKHSNIKYIKKEKLNFKTALLDKVYNKKSFQRKDNGNEKMEMRKEIKGISQGEKVKIKYYKVENRIKSQINGKIYLNNMNEEVYLRNDENEVIFENEIDETKYLQAANINATFEEIRMNYNCYSTQSELFDAEICYAIKYNKKNKFEYNIPQNHIKNSVNVTLYKSLHNEVRRVTPANIIIEEDKSNENKQKTCRRKKQINLKTEFTQVTGDNKKSEELYDKIMKKNLKDQNLLTNKTDSNDKKQSHIPIIEIGDVFSTIILEQQRKNNDASKSKLTKQTEEVNAKDLHQEILGENDQKCRNVIETIDKNNKNNETKIDTIKIPKVCEIGDSNKIENTESLNKNQNVSDFLSMSNLSEVSGYKTNRQINIEDNENLQKDVNFQVLSTEQLTKNQINIKEEKKQITKSCDLHEQILERFKKLQKLEVERIALKIKFEKVSYFKEEMRIINRNMKLNENYINWKERLIQVDSTLSKEIEFEKINKVEYDNENVNSNSFSYKSDKDSIFSSIKFNETLNDKNENALINDVVENESYSEDIKCQKLINKNNSNKNNEKDSKKRDSNLDKREKCHSIHNKERKKSKNVKIDDHIVLEIDDDTLSNKNEEKKKENKLNGGKKIKYDNKVINHKEDQAKSSCCSKTHIKEYNIENQSEEIEKSDTEALTDKESGTLDIENQGVMDLSDPFPIEVEDSNSKKIDVFNDKTDNQINKASKKKKMDKPKYNYYEEVVAKVEIIDLNIRKSEILDTSIDSNKDISYRQDFTDEDFPVNKDDLENPKYWPTYVYRIKQENSSKLIVACVLKAKVGSIGKQKNIECVEISTEKSLPKIDLCEDAASIGFELKPFSEDFKFNLNTPWKLFIPHILPKSSPKELVILSLNETSESWNELQTLEAISDDLKEHKMRFVETKVEAPFSTFIVQTKTKVDTGVINKHGARIASSLDSRVFISVPADAIRITLNTTLKINPIDNNFWKELKSKTEKSSLDQVICASHLIDFSSKKKKLIKPANISCFLPLNPEIKKQIEAQSRTAIPIKKTFSKDSDDDDISIEKHIRSEARVEFDPFQKSLLMTGITGANANESIQVICNSTEEDKWFPLNNIELATDKSKEQISMELPILQSIRFLMVRANRNITVENLAKSMKMIENELNVRNSVITLLKSLKDSNQFILTICLRSRSERCTGQFIEDGYQIELQNAPFPIELFERQIITVKFKGNVMNQKKYRNILSFTHQSLFQIIHKFRVVEIDSYAQRAIDHYRGYLEIFTRKLVKRPIGTVDPKNRKGPIQYHFVEEDVLACQLLLSVPKKKLIHYKAFNDTIFNRNILDNYMTLFSTIAEGVRVSWKDLGNVLQISESRMQSIRHHNNAHQFERMLVQMLIFWLKGLEMVENKPDLLIKALYEMNRTDLINQIKRMIDEQNGSFSDSIL